MFRTISSILSALVISFVLAIGLAGPASAASVPDCTTVEGTSSEVCVGGHPQFVTENEIVVPVQLYQDMRSSNEFMTEVISVMALAIVVLLLVAFGPFLVRKVKKPVETPVSVE